MYKNQISLGSKYFYIEVQQELDIAAERGVEFNYSSKARFTIKNIKESTNQVIKEVNLALKEMQEFGAKSESMYAVYFLKEYIIDIIQSLILIIIIVIMCKK